MYAHVFNRRARLYSSLDERLCSRTRFFRAAAHTNAVLHAVFRAPSGPSRSTERFLGQLGDRLERANVRLARDVAAANFGTGAAAEALDAELIRREQRIAQEHLDALRVYDCASLGRAIADMDRLLRVPALAIPWSWFSRSTDIYVMALEETRSALGRQIRFAAQEDRVCIGLRLIDAIRRGERRAAREAASAG